MKPVIKMVEAADTDAPKILYLCHYCLKPHGDEGRAARCCACATCVDGIAGGGAYSSCSKCRAEATQRRIDGHQANLRKLPWINYAGEPIYISLVDRYFPDYDTAMDWLCDDYDYTPGTHNLIPAFDDGDKVVPIFDVILQPCKRVKAAVPDLIDAIEESWFEQIEELDDGLRLDDPLRSILTGVQALVVKASPELWEPLPARLRLVWRQHAVDVCEKCRSALGTETAPSLEGGQSSGPWCLSCIDSYDIEQSIKEQQGATTDG